VNRIVFSEEPNLAAWVDARPGTLSASQNDPARAAFIAKCRASN